MKLSELIRKNPDNRIGYLPQLVSETAYGTDVCKKMERIPNKISAYFHREKIKEVFKSDFAKDPLDNYYLIKTTDETVFLVEY